MKTNILSLFTVLLTVCCVFILYISYDKDRGYLKQQKISERNYATLQKSIRETTAFTVLSDCKSLSPKDSLIHITENEKIFFSWDDLHKKIFLIIPERSCNTCYDEVFESINYAKDSLQLEVEALTTSNTYKEVINTFKDFHLSIKLYYSYNSHLFSDVKLSNTPYFININDMKFQNLFIPIKNQSHLTRSYLVAMNERFFMQNAAP